MFVYIPGEIIALLTFPGVILHEIAHRFFCDINRVAVYEINYFMPISTKAGHVIHEKTDNLLHVFFIAIGPLIINSLVCIVLTFPIGCSLYLDTNFVEYSSPLISIGYYILAWVGYSAGFHAMPSDQDVSGLEELAQSTFVKTILVIFKCIVALFNLSKIGFFINAGFAFLLSMSLPLLVLH